MILKENHYKEAALLGIGRGELDKLFYIKGESYNKIVGKEEVVRVNWFSEWETYNNPQQQMDCMVIDDGGHKARQALEGE